MGMFIFSLPLSALSYWILKTANEKHRTRVLADMEYPPHPAKKPTGTIFLFKLAKLLWILASLIGLFAIFQTLSSHTLSLLLLWAVLILIFAAYCRVYHP